MASHRANASGLCMGREAFTSDPAARAWFLKHGGATCRSELPRERFRSFGPEEKNPLWHDESGNWGAAAIDLSKDACATTIATRPALR